MSGRPVGSLTLFENSCIIKSNVGKAGGNKSSGSTRAASCRSWTKSALRIFLCSAFLFFKEKSYGWVYDDKRRYQKKWGIGERRINTLCQEQRIEGAVKFANSWAIPSDAEKPTDNRIRSGKYIKAKGEHYGKGRTGSQE